MEAAKAETFVFSQNRQMAATGCVPFVGCSPSRASTAPMVSGAVLNGLSSIFREFRRGPIPPRCEGLEESIRALVLAGNCDEITEMVTTAWSADPGPDYGWLDDQLYFLFEDGGWQPDEL